MSGRLAALVHEKGPADYEERLAALQERLYRLHIAYHRRQMSAIILLEGWDAAGKGGLIKRLTADLDPRFIEVVPVAAPNEIERAQHYMARFWSKLPPSGTWTIFDRSWYGRVLVERVEGFASPEEWGRAYAEINGIEAMMCAAGTRIVKLFLHVSAAEQGRRLQERVEQPWKRWKVGPDDFRNRARRADYDRAYEEMFERTDTPHAPWRLIAADSKKHARLTGLVAIADRLEAGLDLHDPPLSPELRALAERELGRRITPRD
ncbi:MAG: polyphosphate kinase 2 family protein [Thermaurantiacus sp.]